MHGANTYLYDRKTFPQGTEWLVPKCPLFGGFTLWIMFELFGQRKVVPAFPRKWVYFETHSFDRILRQGLGKVT